MWLKLSTALFSFPSFVNSLKSVVIWSIFAKVFFRFCFDLSSKTSLNSFIKSLNSSAALVIESLASLILASSAPALMRDCGFK